MEGTFSSTGFVNGAEVFSLARVELDEEGAVGAPGYELPGEDAAGLQDAKGLSLGRVNGAAGGPGGLLALGADSPRHDKRRAPLLGALRRGHFAVSVPPRAHVTSLVYGPAAERAEGPTRCTYV